MVYAQFCAALIQMESVKLWLLCTMKSSPGCESGFFSFLLILRVLQVDKLEEESSAYLQSVGEATALSSTQQKVETLYTIH